MSKSSRVPLLAVISAILLLCSCSGEAPDPQPPAANAPRNPLEVIVRPDLMRQITVGEPKVEAVTGTIHVAGRVEADETRLARISAPVAGRVMELDVIEGQVVKRGQVLATIHSTDLSAVQSAFLKADSQHELAARAVTRARQLLEAGVIGEAELLRREAELREANAELSAAKEQLKVLGVTQAALDRLQKSRAVDSIIPVVATIDGRVLERKITIGQIVQAAEIICVVADLSRVWLVADVPEQTAGEIQVGKTVHAEIPALPGLKLTGRLSYVSAVVNPETRTVRARMSLPNDLRRLKPAMLANVTMLDSPERRPVIPLTAVVREANTDSVFVQTGPDRFVLKGVTLGPEFRQGRPLVDGLRPGDRIVLDGAFHLNNERKRQLLETGAGA